MVKPEISIIIVNYNSGDYLLNTLKSIIANPPSHEWEVIVFDNQSTDKSIETARNAFKDNSHIRFTISSSNYGFAGGNNKAISESQGQFLLLLNPDTEVTENAIDSLIGFLKENPDMGVCGPFLINSDDEPTVSFGYFPSYRGILAGAFLPKRFQGMKSGGLGIAPSRSINAPIDVDYVSGACLTTKRAIFDEVGPLDEGYFAYFEETDWCLRVKKKGYRIVFIPTVIVKHHEGKSFASIQEKKMRIFVQSAIRFFDRHYSPFLKFHYIFTNITASILKIIYLSMTCRISAERRNRVIPIISHHKAFLKALIMMRPLFKKSDL